MPAACDNRVADCYNRATGLRHPCEWAATWLSPALPCPLALHLCLRREHPTNEGIETAVAGLVVEVIAQSTGGDCWWKDFSFFNQYQSCLIVQTTPLEGL
ncbi:hypothetical protein Y032_1137g3669 [Ancylostoma ceylanicum]|uniref:Uncharacterized protein n=1 Tax=Ancylostoma ceylanicum TaxID=53326 RepID=A0A016W686_9BILA|nr:hypothetical protein Y032_1137g3669 [Ancylostoma ceylanicum]